MPLGTRRTPDHPVALIQLEDLQSRVRLATARIDAAMTALAGNRQACDALLDVRLELCPPRPSRPER